MADLSTTAGALMLWTAERLLTGSVQGAVIIGVVWLVCRRIASVPASIRAMLWWLASLKLVLALMPLPALPLALLPPQERVPTEIVHTASTAAALPAIVAPAVALRPASEMRTVSDRAVGAVDIIPWLAVVIVLWLAGIGVQAVQLLSSLRRLRRVAAESVALGTEDTVVARRIADGLGLRRIPEIRVSDEIDSPQVVGLRRPVMLLPSAVITTFTPNERAMTLCHELVHVRRHDLALGWVPALAERLFFFHPLARVAAREYVIAREAACDAAVLRALDVAPQEYGRLLVRFGVTRFVPGFSATGASSSTSSLRRRLDMLHHTTLSRASRRATWLLACVVALALLPFQLVARTSGEPAAVRTMVITPGNTGGADAGAAPRTAAADVTQERASLPRASVEAFRWLNERLIELKKRAGSADPALQQFQEQQDAMALDDRQNTVIQQFGQASTALVMAQADRVAKEASYRQLEQVLRQGTPLDTFPPVQSSSIVQNSKAELASLKAELQKLSQTKLDSHPDILETRKDIEDKQQELNGEIARITESIKQDYDTARVREEGLRQALESQKRELVDLNKKSIEYMALQRDASSSQQAVESVLQELKEAQLSRSESEAQAEEQQRRALEEMQKALEAQGRALQAASGSADRQGSLDEQQRAMDALRQNLRDARASLERQRATEELRKAERAGESIRELERKLEALGDLSGRGATQTPGSPAEQIERLLQQQERLVREQRLLEQQSKVLVEQQEKLAATQRQLSTEAARLIEALKKAAAEKSATPAK